VWEVGTSAALTLAFRGRNPSPQNLPPHIRLRTGLYRGPMVSRPAAVAGSGVASPPVFAHLEGMDVHLTNPDLQSKLTRWATETGRGPDELVEDSMAGYFDELARTREMLNSRYDGLKSGRVKPVSRDELVAHLREKSAASRQTRSPANDRL